MRFLRVNDVEKQFKQMYFPKSRKQDSLFLSSKGVGHRGGDEGGAGAHHPQGAARAARRRSHRQVVGG